MKIIEKMLFCLQKYLYKKNLDYFRRDFSYKSWGQVIDTYFFQNKLIKIMDNSDDYPCSQPSGGLTKNPAPSYWRTWMRDVDEKRSDVAQV